MYEFTITFNKEVELFWKRKITLSSVLFLLNRYLPLIVNMIYAPWPLSLSPKTQAVGDISHSVMYRAELGCRGKRQATIMRLSQAYPEHGSCKALVWTAETLEIFQYFPWAGAYFSKH